MPTSIEEYFEQSGAIEVLCAIDPGGTRFKVILDRITISRSTLSERLNQAENAGLVERKAISGEQGTNHTWNLTHTGGLLWFRMNTLGVRESFQVYREARERFEQKKVELKDWVTQNPDKLDEPDIGLDKLFQADNLDSNPFPDPESQEE